MIDKKNADPTAVAHDPRLPTRLLKQFDRLVPHARRVLVVHYGEDLTEALVREIRQECATLIARIPYTGSSKDPLAWNLDMPALFLASASGKRRGDRTILLPA